MKTAIIVLCIVGILLGTFMTFSAGARPGIDDVRAKHEHSLIAMKGVSGVASDKATNEIVVYTETQTVCDKVPKELDGFKVRCEAIGRIEALQPTAVANYRTQYVAPRYSRTAAQNPLFGGISVMTSVYPNAAGTLGLVTQDNQVLSCAHVLAMDAGAKFVDVGTAVWQPGGLDSGGVAHPIGTLSKWIPIAFDGSDNYADAATASLSGGVGAKPGKVLDATNRGFVSIQGSYTSPLTTRDSVSKSGRTTGVTTNRVFAPSATVVVWYSDTVSATFKDQLLVRQPFSQAGDSGSVVYKNGRFVGLLFAGSSQITVVCKATYVTNGLGITI